MSRTLTVPTSASPFRASWTAASLDLSAAGTVGPVELPIPGDADYLRISTAGDASQGAGVATQWYIILVDKTIQVDEAEPTKIAVIQFNAIDSTTDNLTHFDNGGGFILQIGDQANGFTDVIDIRGLPRTSHDRDFYLALGVLGGGGANYYLMDFWTWSSGGR